MNEQEKIQRIKTIANYICCNLEKKCNNQCDIRCGVYRLAHDIFYQIWENALEDYKKKETKKEVEH